MSKLILWAGGGPLVALLFGATPAWAAPPNLDGSSPIICAVMAVTECDRWGVCEPADAGAAGLPPFIRVDVGKKSLEATDGSGRRSEIQSSTLVPDKERLILQGGERAQLERGDRSALG